MSENSTSKRPAENIVSYVKGFLDESGTEISGYLASSIKNRNELAYWLIIAFLFIGFTLSQIVLVSIKYISLPTSTNVVPLLKQTLTLPNMTLCFRLETRSIMNDLSWSEAEPLLQEFLGNLPCSDFLSEDCEWFEEETQCVFRSGCADSRRCNFAAAPYLGNKSSTLDGRDCANWMSDLVPPQYKTPYSIFTYELGNHSYCRLTTRSDSSRWGKTPWCYTKDGKYDFCFPDCSTAKKEDAGMNKSCVNVKRDCLNSEATDCADYRGKKTKTRTGKSCLSWDRVHNQRYSVTNETIEAWDLGKHRFCRSADQKEPWCWSEEETEENCFYPCPPETDDLGSRIVLATAVELTKIYSIAEFHSDNPGSRMEQLLNPSQTDTALLRMVDLLQTRFQETGRSESLKRIIDKASRELCKLAGVDWFQRYDDAFGFDYARLCWRGWEEGFYAMYSESEKERGEEQVCFHLPTATLPRPFDNERDELTLELKLGRLYRNWDKYIKRLQLSYGRTPIVLELREKTKGYISDLGHRLVPGYRQNIMMDLNSVFELHPPKHPNCETIWKTVWNIEESCFYKCVATAALKVCGLNHCLPATGQNFFAAGEYYGKRICTAEDYRAHCTDSQNVTDEIKLEKEQCIAQCPTPCTRKEYHTHLKEFYDYDRSTLHKWPGANYKYTSVSMWFGGFTYTLYQEVPIMPPPVFLSEIGGTLGLYLGLSLVPFAHLLLYLVKTCFKCKSSGKISIQVEPSANAEIIRFQREK